MTGPTEDQLESQAKRLFPHIREQLHDPDELAALARKLKPHNDNLDAQAVGQFVVGEAKGLLQKAMWLLGALLLAFAAWVSDFFKWTR